MKELAKEVLKLTGHIFILAGLLAVLTFEVIRFVEIVREAVL